MIYFSNKSEVDIHIERSKVKYRNLIYILSVFINIFCVSRNITFLSNFSVFIVIGEFLYKCGKINNISTILIIVLNYWVGTINGYFTIIAIMLSLIIVFSLISIQTVSHNRYIIVFGQWFKTFYVIQLAIFLILVNIVHKLLLWEVMIVSTGHLLCFWLYFQISTSDNIVQKKESFVHYSQELCMKCQMSIPHRGHHCSVCNRCSSIAQYHNAWINTCINQSNRRAYLVLCILAALTNVYQIHLCITSVCTPKMFIDWFLFVDDCRYIYSDVIYSWIFVSCVFNMVFTAFLLMTIVYEIVLISQNVTHLEFVNCLTFTNCINKGFVGNWMEFLSTRTD